MNKGRKRGNERAPAEQGGALRASPAGSVTIKDVAASLGVSHSTVSRALNDHADISTEMKERVRQAALELGYVVNEGARSLRQAEGRVIGALVPDVGNGFISVLLKTLAALCDRESYQLLLCLTEDDPQTELRHTEMLRRNRARGIVVTPTPRMLPETARLLAAMPTVQFSRSHPLLDAPCVSLDGRQGIESAVRHLADLGHRRIAFIGLNPALSTGAARVEAFQQAMIARGLEMPARYMNLGAASTEFSRSATAALLRGPDAPTAILYGSADLTLGGLEAVRQAGVRLPQDLSVVGFGDPQWLRVFEPGVSTINLNVAQSVEVAVSILLRQVEGTPAPAEQLSRELETYLIVRETTAPPRAQP